MNKGRWKNEFFSIRSRLDYQLVRIETNEVVVDDPVNRQQMRQTCKRTLSDERFCKDASIY